jgi:hypothetical protein
MTERALTTPRMLLSFTGIFTFLVDAYPQYAASAMAANSFARCSFAGMFAHPPLEVTQLLTIFLQLLFLFLVSRCTKSSDINGHPVFLLS